MNQHIVSRIATYLLALVMLVFGIYHFMAPKNLLVYVPSFIPGGIIWVYVVGIAFILAALSFFTNRWVTLAAYLLAALLFLFVLTIHLPNYLNAGDSEMKEIALISLLKDTAIAAFALFIASNSRHQHITEALD